MSDQPIRTRLRLERGDEVGFQEYFVKLRHGVAVSAVSYSGAAAAFPAPGVLEQLTEAELSSSPRPTLCCRSTRSFRCPGSVRCSGAAGSVVGVSPIVAGAALEGPGRPAPRRARGDGERGRRGSMAAGRVRDPRHRSADAASAGEVEAAGVRCVITDTVMSSPQSRRRPRPDGDRCRSRRRARRAGRSAVTPAAPACRLQPPKRRPAAPALRPSGPIPRPASVRGRR